MVLVSVVVATDVVPGLRWDRLEIWENSASHDVWARLSEYVEFRSYVLGALGGRVLLPWMDAKLVRLKLLRTDAAAKLATFGRPICELFAAGAAMVVLGALSPSLLRGAATLNLAM